MPDVLPLITESVLILLILIGLHKILQNYLNKRNYNNLYTRIGLVIWKIVLYSGIGFLTMIISDYIAKGLEVANIKVYSGVIVVFVLSLVLYLIKKRNSPIIP